MGVTFSYSDAKNKKHTLALELNPYAVNWNYNVNTHVQDTYTGQVVQVLSVNIDKLVIEGQLGIEGPYGRDASGTKERNHTQQFNPAGRYPGLHAMAEFFREYFAIMSQGADKEIPGQYTETPMTISYGVDQHPLSRFWPQIIPTSFPSFKRSLDNFAPMWRVEAHVIEADRTIQNTEKKAALQRIQQGIGYKVGNPFSDPALNNREIVESSNRLLSGFRALLPSYTQEELRELIWNGVSVPRFVDASVTVTQATQDFLAGESNVNVKNNPYLSGTKKG
jgi:hypothetical protein